VLRNFLKTSNGNFAEIPYSESREQTDRQTDMTKPIVAFATVFFKRPKFYFRKIGCEDIDWIQQAQDRV
jgi:hypothetical protein